MFLVGAITLIQYAVWVLILSIFVLVVGWAINAAIGLRDRRRGLEAHREELASDVLKSTRIKGDVPTVKKPLVYLPENLVEEAPKADSPDEPWLSMLVQPAATIRQIVDFDPQFYVMLLACLYGINSIMGAGIGDPNSKVSYVILLPVALIAGPIAGIIFISLASAAIRSSAQLFRGVASEHETQAALAWSLLPQIYTLPLTCAVAIAVAPDFNIAKTRLAVAAVLVFLVASLVAQLWSFVLWLFAIAEVNQFTLWDAFFTLLISMMIMALLLVAILLPFVAMYFMLGLSPYMFLLAIVMLAAGMFIYGRLSAS